MDHVVQQIQNLHAWLIAIVQKDFQKTVKDTNAGSDGYPHYRRRDTGKCVNKSGVLLDNKCVVPYNPYLSKRYNAHINVEICGSVQSCKYLYKYVYKGPHITSVGVEPHDKHDEIKKFVNSRFITGSECMWRFFSFDVHGRDQSVQCLVVHENNQHSVIFHEDKPQEALGETQTTTLLGWFELIKCDEGAQKLKYHEIPEHYIWNNRRKQWLPQKKGKTIGQMYTTNPAEGERHYLWMPLHHIPGHLSYDDLRTLPDGTKCGSFKETTIHLDLLVTNDGREECLTEASASYLPSQICSLFVTILVFGEPLKPYDLWMKHKDAMGEDILWKVSKMESIHPTKLSAHVDNSVLLLLQNDLCELGTSLDNFGLPTPNTDDIVYGYPHVIQDEILRCQSSKQKAKEILLHSTCSRHCHIR